MAEKKYVVSIDVGYRNLATVLAIIKADTGIEIKSCDLCDVLPTLKKPKTVHDTVHRVIEHVDNLIQQWDLEHKKIQRVIVEQQVRKSGMNYAIAYGLMGYFRAFHVNFAFMRAKSKFDYCIYSSHANLKKRSIEEVASLISNSNETVDLSNVKSFFENLKKQDDIADAILQVVCYGYSSGQVATGNERRDAESG